MTEPAEQRPISQKHQVACVKPRRPWRFQFGLLTLLVLVAVAAMGAMAWRVYVDPYRRQRKTMALIENLGGSYKTSFADTWVNRWFDLGYQDITEARLNDCDDPDAYLRDVLALPRLHALAVGGSRFEDECLLRLRDRPTLRTLVLDTTSVTEEGVASLAGSLPSLEVSILQTQAVDALRKRVDVAGGWAHWQEVAGNHRIRVVDYAYTFPRTTTDGDLADIVALLPRAYHVTLEHSQVTDTGLKHLGGLAGLHELTLGFTQVTDAGLIHLRELTALQELDVEGCRVGDSGLEHLAALPHHESLTLRRTLVTDAGVANLRHLRRLKILQLDTTAITDVATTDLAGMPQLERLFLSETQITDAGLARLSALRLKSIALVNSKVTDAGLAHLKKTPTLEAIYLLGSQATESGIEDLQRALPECTIRWQ